MVLRLPPAAHPCAGREASLLLQAIGNFPSALIVPYQTYTLSKGGQPPSNQNNQGTPFVFSDALPQSRSNTRDAAVPFTLDVLTTFSLCALS